MPAPDREPRTPKARPDPRPMRLAFGITGLVAATAMVTSIMRPPVPIAAPAPDPSLDPASWPTPSPIVIRHVTRYVQLKAGQTAPPGANVVQKPEASPRIVFVTVPAPAPRRVVVVTTRQSGGK